MLQSCIFIVNKSDCVFYSLLSEFYLIGDEIYADNFKDEITTSLKANNRIKFSLDVELHNVIEN